MTNSLKPVIFLAFANDRVDGLGYLRNLAEEAHRLREALRPAEKAGLCEIVLLQNVTVERVQNVFLDSEYRDRVAVFHFGGHANGYELLLESREGDNAVADAAGFSKFLAEQDGLRLVFLNGCSTGAQVQGLLDAGIEAVIATSRAIDDDIAMEFSDRFYTSLSNRASVGRAFREAESAIQMGHGSQTRDLYIARVEEEDVDRSKTPWDLTIQPGSESMAMEHGLQRWAQLLPFKRKPFEPKTVLIPGGAFLMGSEPGEGVPKHETPQHEVTLPLYRIGEYAVSNQEYAAFLDDIGQMAPPELGWEGNTPPKEKMEHPVAGVTWYEAVAYCDWLSNQTERKYTLPSEAQWEKAAQGTYGCRNMVGTGREWTTTLWGSKSRMPDDKFKYPWVDDDGRDSLNANSQIRRVIRGGTRARSEGAVYVSWRDGHMPDQRGLPGARIGFRIVMRMEQ